jgi:hypothetical protein
MSLRLVQPGEGAHRVTGRAPLVDAVAYYSGLAPWAVVLLLGMLLAVGLLVGAWIFSRSRR